MFSRQFYTYVLKLYAVSLLFLLALRITLLTWYSSLLMGVKVFEIVKCLVFGAMIDCCVLSCAFFLCYVLSILFVWAGRKFPIKLFSVLSIIALTVILFVNTVDIFYYKFFGLRLNMMAEEAIHSPTEIIYMVWHTFPVAKVMLGFAVLMAIFIFLHRRILKGIDWNQAENNIMWAVFTILTFAALSFLYMGMPLWYYTISARNSLVNQASLNGVYTIASSFNQKGIFTKDIPDFNFTTDSLAIQSLQNLIVKSDEKLLEGAFPTLRQPTDSTAFQKKNIVFVLMESFGAAYAGCLNNGIGFSPNFDNLSKEGVLFTKFRSNGPRTANGLFSITTGYPSIFNASLIRRKGINEIQSIGNILAKEGYHTQFMCCGNADYDDMRLLMLQGGFEKVYSQDDYKTWHFKNKWGVCDEDMYSEALKRLWSTDGKPTMSLLLTVSNHMPWEIPQSFIDTHPELKGMTPQQTAYYYSDYALGKFIAECKKRPEYKNTIFFICGDHAEPYSERDNDCKIVHIPALLLNSSKAPQQFNHVASQCDVAPTVLNDLGYSAPYHFIGQNIFAPGFIPYAFSVGYPNHEVMMATDSAILFYNYDINRDRYYSLTAYEYMGAQLPPNPAATLMLQQYLQAISKIYREGRYRFE